MKNNLKTFPKLYPKCVRGDRCGACPYERFCTWKMDFEAELRGLLLVAKLKPKEDIFAKAIEYFIEEEILGE